MPKPVRPWGLRMTAETPANADARPARRAAHPTAVPRVAAAPGNDSTGTTLTIPRAIAFAGRVGSCERIVVEGVLETDLDACRVLTVARGGVYRGTADIETADIAGTMEGTLTVREILTLHATGRILSEKISYGELVIERGGRAVGTFRPLVEDAE